MTDNSETWYGLGTLALGQGKLDEAEAAFGAALALNPNHANSMYRLGEVAQARGNKEQALGLYMRTLELHPGHVSATNQISRLRGEPVPKPSASAESTSRSRQRPLTELDLPSTEDEWQEYRKAVERKRKIDFWAGIRASPISAKFPRVAYFLFTGLILTGFVVVLAVIIFTIPR